MGVSVFVQLSVSFNAHLVIRIQDFVIHRILLGHQFAQLPNVADVHDIIRNSRCEDWTGVEVAVKFAGILKSILHV